MYNRTLYFYNRFYRCAACRFLPSFRCLILDYRFLLFASNPLFYFRTICRKSNITCLFSISFIIKYLEQFFFQLKYKFFQELHTLIIFHSAGICLASSDLWFINSVKVLYSVICALIACIVLQRSCHGIP